MAKDDMSIDSLEDEVLWTSRKKARSGKDRRSGVDRRQLSGRMITVPDMRSGIDRRSGEDRRKVRLVITGRAMDV
ncbi:hypothetical protein [Aliikangiella sp. G2MR2-5]|uniref:hypothetical protein n=1 Tax=Aliikangiella sp. G2MR2-5 TaxID=2788943 RepID=UPI0018AA8008|nr:hypothetical protein [Aliikangiella sp. G2MR2-5]